MKKILTLTTLVALLSVFFSFFVMQNQAQAAVDSDPWTHAKCSPPDRGKDVKCYGENKEYTYNNVKYNSKEQMCTIPANNFDTTGVAATRCPKSCNFWNSYGILYFKPDTGDAFETDGVNNVDIRLKGAVFHCRKVTEDQYLNADRIRIARKGNDYDSWNINNVPNDSRVVKYSGNKLTRSIKNNNPAAWGPESTDSIIITMRSIDLDKAPCDNAGKCTESLNVFRCQEGRGDNTCRADETRIYFFKISTITASSSIGYVENTTINDDKKYIVPEGINEIKVNFNHQVNRNDLWTNNAAITSGQLKYCTEFSINDGAPTGCSLTEQTNMSTTSSYTVKYSDLSYNKDYNVCSRIKSVTKVGLGGYKVPNQGEITSEWSCAPIRKEELLKVNNVGHSSATANGVTTHDVTNSSLVKDPDGKTNSASASGGILVQNYTINFTHEVATVNGGNHKITFHYKIDRQTNGGNWESVVKDTEVTYTANDNFKLANNVNVPITLGFGATGTICERLTVWDTDVSISRLTGEVKNSSGSATSTVCGSITRKTPKSSALSTGAKSSVDLAGKIVYNTQKNEKNKASYSGSVTTTNQTMDFYHYVTFPSVSSPYLSGEQTFTYTIARSYDGGKTYKNISGEIDKTVKFTPDGNYHLAIKNPKVGLEKAFAKKEYGTKTVCERITVKPKSITFFEQNAKPAQADTTTVSSEVCGEVTRPKPTTITNKTNIKSSVNAEGIIVENTEAGENNKASYSGDSKIANYKATFDHFIKFPAKSDTYPYGAQTFTYTIEQKIDGDEWTTVENNKTTTMTTNGKYLLAKSSVKDVPIKNFNTTKTICQRFTVKPKEIKFYEKEVEDAEPNNGTLVSEVCAEIYRPQPVLATITATTSAIVDGQVAVNNGVYTSLNLDANGNPLERTLTFYHNFTHNVDNTIKQDTKYKREYTVQAKKTTTGETTVTVPTANPQAYTHKAKPDPRGTTKIKICEKVVFNPSTFYVHTYGDTQGLDTTSESNLFCVTLATPERKTIDDGEFEVYAKSEAKFNNANQVESFHSGKNAWLMKKDQAEITYSHTLSRTPVNHTNDATKPAENVDVKYRYDDKDASFTASSILNTSGAGSLPSVTIANGGSVTKTSNTTDSLLKKNTIAKIEQGHVGEVSGEYCQSVFYLSQKYGLKGDYYFVDGKIWSKASSMINGSGYAVMKPSTGTVGKSTAACVNVVMPYNFKVTTFEPSKDASELPANPGTPFTGEFTVTIEKNNPSYYITDIPESNIRYIGFTIDGDSPNPDVIGGETSGNLCSLFSNALDCNSNLRSETKAIHNTGSSSSSSTNGKNYYSNVSSYSDSKSITYTTVIPRELSTDKKYCMAAAISPSASAANGGVGFPEDFQTNTWVVSNATCVNIGKKPNVQVWGGSVATNGGIKTSITQTFKDDDTATYGSWDDFLVIAYENIKNMASGAAYISGISSSTRIDYATSRLTIANNEYASRVGYSGIVTENSIPYKLSNRYLNSTDKYRNLDERTGTDKNVINASALESDYIGDLSPVVFYSPSNIYIASNIDDARWEGGAPQVIIYAKGNIYISDEVTRIDALIISEGGVVKTCANKDGKSLRISAKTCQNTLKINGAIFADQVIFDRTYGADYAEGTIAEPAEIVDHSAVLYLWGHSEATNGAEPTTTYLRKMPPRY